MSDEWWEEYDLPKPGRMANKEFVSAVQQKLEEFKNEAAVERTKRKIAEEDREHCRDKIEKLEKDIFGGLKRILNDNDRVIGLKDKEGDAFYLNGRDPKIGTLRSDVERLESELKELKEKYRKVNQEKNRAKKRYAHAEQSLREVTLQSGLKVLFQIDDCTPSESGIPFDIPDIYDPREGPIAQVCYYKGKIWLHKNEGMNDYVGEVLVDGEDFRKNRRQKIGLSIGSKIKITAGEPYDEAHISFVNENIA